MAEIVNLRMARKAAARGKAEAAASQNRAKFGRSKAEKAGAALDNARAERRLDSAKRED
ncbi:DUF4169 family protein [Novosphingobium sp. Chol11]|uniref:DUF4169 family protein n=1 Tax=Novosphingobium sp. Chol11 TaxID=1385763 RepID=UPI0025D3B903|nr:DUF4169 family protein [Novosphingobium sp. Chol11]